MKASSFLHFFRRSISRQISLLLVVLIFTTLVIFGVFFYKVQSNSLQLFTEQMARQLLNSLTTTNAKYLHFRDNFSSYSDIKNQMKNNKKQLEYNGLFKIDEVALLDTDGNVFAHSLPKENPIKKLYVDLIVDDPLKNASELDVKFYWVDIADVKAVRIYSNIQFQGRTVGSIILQLNLSLLQQQQNKLIVDFIIGSILFLIFSIFAALIFGRWLSKPVSIIENSMSEIGTGQLHLDKLMLRKDEYGKLACAVKKADKKLYSSQVQISLLLDSTAEAIYGISLDGICTFVNNACLKYLGYDNESEVLGAKMHELIHHSYPDGTPYPSHQCKIYLALSEGVGTHVDDEFLWRKDGTGFAAEYWSHPIFENNVCTGSVVTFLDITERVKHQNTIKEIATGVTKTSSGAYFNHLVVHIAKLFDLDCVFIGLLKTETEEHIKTMAVYSDGKIVSNTTYPLKNTPCYNVMHGGTCSYESDVQQHFPKDKLLVDMNVESYIGKSLFDSSGRLLGILVLLSSKPKQYTKEMSEIIDIFAIRASGEIERLHAEETLRRSQKMEAIGQLSGGIAHDFNNQLGVIFGYLDFLKEYVEGDKKPSQWVDTALNSANRCMDLTRQLLSFSRKSINKKVVVNINEKLVELQTMFKRSVTPQIEIEYNLSDDIYLIDIDPGELQDAVLNLIINARDAMPKGGKLLIETSNLFIDSDLEINNSQDITGDFVQLSITDNGCGMDRITQERVFEPFYSTKDKGKGTGLGMAMVYGFVQRFSGYIKIYSEVDVGTSTRIYLPRSLTSVVDSVTVNKIEQAVPKGNEAILITDDEEDLLNMANISLKALGYKTYTANNAVQALEVLEKNSDIDLLFSDVIMPGGMNGFELAKLATDKYPNLKVLMSSGFTSKSITDGIESQYTGEILNKPYRQIELAKYVRRALDLK